MITRLLSVVLFLTLSFQAHSDVRFASWNIKHFGWNNGKQVEVLAAIISGFDLIAIQELMDDQELIQLEKYLENLTGDSWTHMASHAIGRGSYREHYGFIWRNSEVSYLDGAVVYLDNRDVFAREPYSARFLDRDTDKSFAVSTVHILYGDSVSDRTPEIKALSSYWEWLQEVYPEEKHRIILAGDFNLEPDHEAWSYLKKYAKPLITKGATTLSKANGKYTSLYDNIWVSSSTDFDLQISGVFKFTQYMDMITGRFWSNEEARKLISDHAPVYTLIGTQDISMKTLNPSDYTDSKTGNTTGSSHDKKTYEMSNKEPGSSCVDINSDPAYEIQKIPYIGSQRASLVISQRPWESMDDLTRIRGIGKGTLKKIKDSGVVCKI